MSRSSSSISASVASSSPIRRFLALGCARISSSILRCSAVDSRFWLVWMANTIRKVTMVVPVLMTSCHVSLKPKSGPVTNHTTTIASAATIAQGVPTARVIASDQASEAVPFRGLRCGCAIGRPWPSQPDHQMIPMITPRICPRGPPVSSRLLASWMQGPCRASAFGRGTHARLRPHDGRQRRVLQLRAREPVVGTGLPLLRRPDAAGRRRLQAPSRPAPD